MRPARGVTIRVVRIAGCDLGKARAKFVVARAEPDGRVVVERRDVVDHEGRPLEAFQDWYRRAGVGGCAALGATGLFAGEIAPPALCGLPEEACVEAALRARADLAGPLKLVSVGARGYAALSRDAEGRVRFLA